MRKKLLSLLLVLLLCAAAILLPGPLARLFSQDEADGQNRMSLRDALRLCLADWTGEIPIGGISDETLLFPLNDGRELLLDRGHFFIRPGLYDTDAGLYCVEADGGVLRDGDYGYLHFGPDGRYSSGNAQIDAYVDQIVAEIREPSMSRLEKLRAVYDRVFADAKHYLGATDHPPHGQDDALWMERFMLRLMERGMGNCYCFAAETCYLARRVGFDQIRAISGASERPELDHAWAELELDGTLYLLDPRADARKNESSGMYFLVTYETSPTKYFPPDRPED